MAWWIWAVAGLVLLIGEMLTPGGLFAMFFAAGALIIAVLELSGVHLPLWVQLVVFAGVSIGAILLFRKPILRRLEKKDLTHDVDTMIGEEAVAQGAIPAGQTGSVEFRGTTWKADNTGAETIADGEVCLVMRVNGLRFEVRKRTVPSRETVN